MDSSKCNKRDAPPSINDTGGIAADLRRFTDAEAGILLKRAHSVFIRERACLPQGLKPCADDALQDAFVYFCENHSLDYKGITDEYVAKFIRKFHSSLIDVLRHESFSESCGEEEFEHILGAENPHDAADARLAAEPYMEELKKHSMMQYEVFWRHNWYGFSMKEIAAQLTEETGKTISEDDVNHYHANAKKFLRKLSAKWGQLPIK